AGEQAGVVESVKAASDIYAPVSGEVVAVNGALGDSPERVDSDPYGSWVYHRGPAVPAQLDTLLDAAGHDQAAGDCFTPRRAAPGRAPDRCAAPGPGGPRAIAATPLPVRRRVPCRRWRRRCRRPPGRQSPACHP